MVVSTLRLFPPREERRHVLGTLRSVQGPTQAMARCLGCHLLEEDGDENAVLFVEKWESEEALQAHIQSDLYDRILAIAELSRNAPEFKFHFVKESRGFDLVKSLRQTPVDEGIPDERTS